MTRQTARLRASRAVLDRMRPLVFERDGHVCALCGGWGPLQIQHRVPRQMGGRSRDPDTHRLDRLVLVCAVCHDWIERQQRGVATKWGYLVPAGMDATRCPVKYWDGRWYLLDAEGGRRLVASVVDGEG